MRSTQLAILAALASYSNQKEPMAMVDTTRPLVPMKDYKPPNDWVASNPDYYYPTNYRVLNCWECFEAQGKICMDEGHNSLYHLTGSGDPGNAFCCKPGSNEGHCKHGSIHDYPGKEEGITTVCSQPSTGATNDFKSILTNNRNHQMFAFCPSINHQKCGVQGTTGSSTNMALKAGISKQHVETSDMKYKKPNSQDKSREYDACYYEITLDISTLGKYNPKQLHLQITGKSGMNVFIYGGQNRMTATESLVTGNEQVSVGQTYSVGIDKGFLVVAYPDENVQNTQFGFNYWLEAVSKEDEKKKDDNSNAVEVKPNQNVNQQLVIGEPEQNDNSMQQVNYQQKQSVAEMDEMMFYGLCAGAVILLIAIIFVCYKCRSKGKITTHGTQDLGYPNVSGNNSNERSLHIESLGDDENQNDTNRDSSKGNDSNKQDHGKMTKDTGL